MTDLTCPYNAGVNCDPADRHCETCGWNPDRVKGPRPRKQIRRPQQGPTRCRRVAKVNAHGKVIEVYTSATMAAEQNCIARSTVRKRCMGEIIRPSLDLGGCTFKYID